MSGAGAWVSNVEFWSHLPRPGARGGRGRTPNSGATSTGCREGPPALTTGPVSRNVIVTVPERDQKGTQCGCSCAQRCGCPRNCKRRVLLQETTGTATCWEGEGGRRPASQETCRLPWSHANASGGVHRLSFKTPHGVQVLFAVTCHAGTSTCRPFFLPTLSQNAARETSARQKSAPLPSHAWHPGLRPATPCGARGGATPCGADCADPGADHPRLIAAAPNHRFRPRRL